MENISSNTRFRELPETINIHLTRTCNFGCRYCYAGFAECGSVRIPPNQLRQIVAAIGQAEPLPDGRRRKVNFAGGEPLLYAGLPDAIGFSKQLGFLNWWEEEGSKDMPVLVAYCRGLAERHGRQEVLWPKCEALLAKLHSLEPGT